MSDAVGPVPGVSDELYDRYQDLLAAQAALRTAVSLEQAASARLGTTGLAVAEAVLAFGEADAAAREARDILTAFTREAYMEGSELSLIAGLAAMEADDIVSALSSTSYLDRVARYRIDAAVNAIETAARAKAAVESAKADRLQAEAAATTARARTASARAAVSEAQQAYNAAMAAGVPPQVALGPDGCPTTSLPGVLREGAETVGLAALCQKSVAQAGSPWAQAAIKWAFAHLGAPYACGGVGRDLPFRFDCSSLVSRAYHEGAGLPTAGSGWAPSTRDMVPWDGVKLGPNYFPVARAFVRPGDLALYDTGGTVYRHVVMVLADGYMLHTNRCGDVAHVERFWGMDDGRFLGARRVLPTG